MIFALPLKKSRLSARFSLMLLISLMVMGLSALSISMAQDEAESDDADGSTPRILEMLALVPDNPAFTQEDLIGFSDFRAQAATRSGAQDYDSWEDFQAAREAEDPAARLLLNSWGMSGLPNIMNYLHSAGSDIPEMVGFDFFDIDAAMSFGRPPNQVHLYQGDFNARLINAALTSNGYTAKRLDGFSYWCAEAGCDTGSRVNPAEIQPANLFGGDLGRRFPVALLDSYIAASPNDANVETIAEVYQNPEDSLAANPIYQTAVSAMYDTLPPTADSDQPLLRQAYFIPAHHVMVSDPTAMAALTSPEEVEKLREQLESMETTSIPLYQLAAFSDFGNSSYQYAQVVLVYGLKADAEVAVEIIPKRIGSMTSLVTRQPLAQMFEDRGAELLTPVVYHDEDAGRYAAVFTFRYPAASEEPDEIGFVPSSGMVYRLLTDALMRRDTLWLSPLIELPE